MPSVEYGPGGVEERPTPRLSNWITRCVCENTGVWSVQPLMSAPRPMISSIGSPLPVSS